MTTRAYGTTRRVGVWVRQEGVERTDTIIPSKHVPGGKVFHIQAKRVKLYGTRVVSGDRKNGSIAYNGGRVDQRGRKMLPKWGVVWLDASESTTQSVTT
jgi:hypothetical protein